MIIKCRECNHEIEGVVCPGCSESTPEGGNFCINCGQRLRDENTGMADDYDDAMDMDDRILCPDGACTGIIIDGKCCECGKPAEPEA
jgi:hypothetical protein